MARRTALTELLGIEHPVVQAPMAGAATPELAAAVSAAGGLGSLGSATLPADELTIRPRERGALLLDGGWCDVGVADDRAGRPDQTPSVRRLRASSAAILYDSAKVG